MAIHVTKFVIANTDVNLKGTTPEEVIYNLHAPKIEPPKINKKLEHLKTASSGPHYKSYQADMVTPTTPHFKSGYKLKGLEKLHRKSSYVSQFLKE